MLVVVGPQVDPAGGNAIVGIRIRQTCLKGAVPCFADRNDAVDRRGARRRSEIVCGADIQRHFFDGLSVPVTRCGLHLVGAGPRGDEPHVHMGISLP